MRPLQLTILITTAIVLFAAGGYAMWHTWQEQELPYEDIEDKIDSMTPEDRGKAVQPENGRPTLRVHLLAGPVRISQNPANVAPAFRNGTWYQYLWRKENTAGRPHALKALRERLADQLEEAGLEPSEARGVVTWSEGVETDAVTLVLDVFLKLGIKDVVAEAGLTSKERMRKVKGP